MTLNARSLNWFTSYLTRTQVVDFDNVVSSQLGVNLSIFAHLLRGIMIYHLIRLKRPENDTTSFLNAPLL